MYIKLISHYFWQISLNRTDLWWFIAENGYYPQLHSPLAVPRRYSYYFHIFMYVSLSCVSFMVYIYILFNIISPLFTFSFGLGVCLASLVVYVVSPSRSSIYKKVRVTCHILICLTFSPLLTIVMIYANSLYPDETPSNSAFKQDQSCLTPGQHIINFEKDWSTFIADDNLFSGLRVKGDNQLRWAYAVFAPHLILQIRL